MWGALGVFGQGEFNAELWKDMGMAEAGGWQLGVFMKRTKGWGRLKWIGSEIGILSQERGRAGVRAGVGGQWAPKEMDLLNTSDLDVVFGAISCPVFLPLPPWVVFLFFVLGIFLFVHWFGWFVGFFSCWQQEWP